tara:strand:- start:1235 stop:2632 length:1398 start_codon:yes stop_codon:yes gene_type:complete
MPYSSNHHRHRESNSLYAHFSAVDQLNTELYPNLKFTNPIYFKLKKGQSLYIPKGWWHWIKTTSKSFAVNYWFSNNIELNPFIFDYYFELDTNKFNNQDVYIWNSSKYDEYFVEDSFENFYNSGLDDRYVLTLSNYINGENNSNIKNLTKPHVKFPSHDKLQYNESFDFNIWISSGKHDTGLHYDDEDGVLTLLEGSKEITLFPPSDSDNLYAYNTKYSWREKPAINFAYNSFIVREPITGISSSEVLYKTCNEDVRVLSNISKLFEKYGQSLVWGFKKSGDDYRWEIYKYDLQQDPIITSWDLYKNTYEISDVEHYYFKENTNTPLGLPFWGVSKFKKDGDLYEESKIFVLDDYIPFKENYDLYMSKLCYDNIKNKFEKIILKKYKCYQICIHNKTENQIFVQYLGISNKDFLSFLKLYDYPSYIINFVEEQISLDNYKINNEITIVYDTDTQKVIRSGFYGNI